MKIWFVHETDEWGKICESINLYLQYCHDMAHIKIDICKYAKKENPCCDVLNADDIVVVPLFEKVSDNNTHQGLKIIKDLRKKIGCEFNTIFLVLSKQDIPDYLHPENGMHDYAESLLGNPEFGYVDKAVFLGEIIYKEKEAQNENASSKNIEYTNIINLQEHDELKRLADLLKGEGELPLINEELRAKYYDIFIKYYDLIKINGEIPVETKILLNDAQAKYRALNDTQESNHSDGLELFEAPVPFPLIELIQTKEEIEKSLKHKKDPDNSKAPITLLLIDNKGDKVANGHNGALQETIALMEKIGNNKENPLFEVKMLEDFTYTYNKENPAQPEDADIFKLSEFKKDMEEIFDDNTEDSDKNYAIKVYAKTTKCHFVLLDFFLNKENTYLAFDFIHDIAKIKKKKLDSSTTWYFITSAAYDSVAKYSQSGLLAEYYESAVVNAGDDPTNKKRQIIFLYKLLTFINSRFKSFTRYKDIIFYRILGPCPHENIKNRKECCVNVEINACKDESIPIEAWGDGKCEKNKCLEHLQTCIKRYLTEFDNIASIFYGKEKSKRYKRIVERLDDTINKFLLLPEADWQIIQHQIDYINARLEEVGDRGRFSCSHILDEITKRSEIF